MSTLDFHSVRRHFGYDADRSSVIKGVHFFNYLHPFRFFEDEESDNRTHHERVYVVIGPFEITLKLEILAKNIDKGERKGDKKDQTNKLSTHFENLLVIPLDTKHNNFAEIETQLVRLKQREIKKEGLKRKLRKSTFEQIVHHFIEDLYVHDYFKEVGDVQRLKSALEHVPLLQGIIRKFLFDYHYEDCIKIRKKDVRITYKIKQLENAYLNYSRFLSHPEYERLFQSNGWFVNDNNKSESNIDAELAHNVEKKYLEIYKKFGKDFFLVSPFKNTRHILTRYGIVDILRLTFPPYFANLFAVLLGLMVASILTYIGVFQYTVYQLENTHKEPLSESISLWATWSHWGMAISAALFFTYTISVQISLLLDKNKRNILQGIFLPRMTIAIIAALWTLLINEALFKVDMNVSLGLLLVMGGFVIVILLFFMIFEINNHAPSMLIWKRVKRSLIIAGLAFVISFTLGFWGTSYITEKHMSLNSHFLVKESNFIKEFELWHKLHEEKQAELENYDENERYTVEYPKVDSIKDAPETIRKIEQDFKNIIDMINNTSNTKADWDAGVKALKYCLKKSPVYYFSSFLNENKYIEINETKVHYKQHEIILLGKVTIFPNMLLSRTLLAMFIGIFLQLMTRGKPITEPI